MSNGSATATEKNYEERELRIPAEEGQLSRVRDFISDVCEEAGFSTRETNNTKLAVDEACTNIIKHAYETNPGEIRIRTVIGPGHVAVKLHDTGERFDFAGVEDPDLDQYVETGKKGGLGVFLINRLMDDVRYRAGDAGNELTMTKTSHAALARTLPGRISWRGTLRYKFTLRASLGLFVLLAAIWSFVFVRQTGTIKEQQTTQWMEKRRLAENLAERSKALLLEPESYSVEQTSLTAYITRVIEGNAELYYVRVVDSEGTMLSSGNIDEIFEPYKSPEGEVLLRESDNLVWSRFQAGDETIRDIEITVRMRNEDAGQDLTLGTVHLGILESEVAKNIQDPRLLTTLILIVFFLIGVVLIAALVSVFVKPIQVLTDGVRAIGQGSLDSKISVEGPAEIGAIASVFNEITAKFKKAQEGVLEREKLQKEIEVAKQIQHALLPKRHPDISGYDIAPYYQAAKEVGGDYYDFVQVDDDTLGVVVADVSGKGVPGSLVMTMIRTALRMEARGNKNASDVMSKMNDFVTDDMKKGMFVTMFYVILDSKNRIISYASAGHNPMILYRYETNETYFLNPKGFPVGISLPDETLFRRAISLEKIKLKKDDMLLIYTDGVTEAMNEKREQYGEDRLIETIKKYGNLHPTEFIDKLEKDIKNFTGGNAQNDDITVVAVKEKLTADDVLFGIRKKLIDMVEVGGMSVKEACAKMKVSPATFYRYKKRMETMGERGLKNKVLRQDVALKRVSIEERKKLIKIIKAQPELGAKRIAEEYNKENEGARALTQRIVYDELKRLGLNTKDLRVEYLKRHQMYEEDAEAARRSSREMVEELIKEVSSDAPKPEVDVTDAADVTDVSDITEGLIPDTDLPSEPVTPGAADVADLGFDLDDSVFATSGFDEDIDFGDLELTVFDGQDDLSVLQVNGHLDSVSTGALEQKLDEIIAGGAFKIAVDLSHVTYISSGGWGILVGEVKRLRERGGDVVLVGMTPDVYDVYELLGFSEILGALPDIGAAQSYFQKPLEQRISETPKQAPPAPPSELEIPEPSVGMGALDALTEPVSAEWDSLKIEAATVGEKSDMAVLSLTGIIDTVSAENLRSAIDKVIHSGIFKIVVDMSLIEYVSSGGWGTFTERLREVRRQGGDIKLFGMDPDVYYIFTMLGFNIVLSSFDVLTDAIEDFKRAVDGQPDVHPQQPTDGPTLEPATSGEADDLLADIAAAPPAGADLDQTDAVDIADGATAESETAETDAIESADEFITGFEATQPEPTETSERLEPDEPAESVEPAWPAGSTEHPEPAETAEQSAWSESEAPSEPQETVEPGPKSVPLVFRPITQSDDWAEWEESDGVLMCTINGPIEAVAVGRLDQEINAKLESKPVRVFFDLRAVDYISSTGWGLIAKYYDQVNGWGGTVALCGMNQDLFEIFSFLEFHTFIQTYMTREEAVASIESQPAAIDGLPEQPPVETTTAAADESSSSPSPRDDVDTVLASPSDSDEARGYLDTSETVDEILGDVESVERTPGEDVREPTTPVAGGFFEEPDESMLPEDEDTGAMSWADDTARVEDAEPGVGDVEDVPAPPQAPADGEESLAWGGDGDAEGDLEAAPSPLDSDRPVEESADRPVEELADRLVEEPTERPLEEPAESPAQLSVDRWGDEEVGDGVFVDFTTEEHRVDVDSATDDEKLSEDEKLRDMGWSQYGQRLRKIVNREKSRRPKPRDDDDYDDDSNDDRGDS